MPRATAASTRARTAERRRVGEAVEPYRPSARKRLASAVRSASPRPPGTGGMPHTRSRAPRRGRHPRLANSGSARYSAAVLTGPASNGRGRPAAPNRRSPPRSARRPSASQAARSDASRRQQPTRSHARPRSLPLPRRGDLHDDVGRGADGEILDDGELERAALARAPPSARRSLGSRSRRSPRAASRRTRRARRVWPLRPNFGKHLPAPADDARRHPGVRIEIDAVRDRRRARTLRPRNSPPPAGARAAAECAATSPTNRSSRCRRERPRRPVGSLTLACTTNP